MKIRRLILSLIVAIGSTSFAGPPASLVEKNPAPVTTEERPWSFGLIMYGWMQSLDGTIGVRGIDADIDIRFKDILKELNFGMMTVLEARYQRWGFMADMVYADLRGSASTPFDFLFSSVDYEQKQFLGNFVVSYCVVDQTALRLDLYAGARVNWLDAEITLIGNPLQLPPGFPPFIVPNRGFSGSESWADPIVGARLQTRISGPVFARIGGDIGGFGVSSDFTWEVYGVIGVDVARNFSLLMGYRGLGTDYSNDGFKYDVIAHGPAMGAEFRF